MIQKIEPFSRKLIKNHIKYLKISRGKNRISTFYELYKLEDPEDSSRQEIANSYRSGRMCTLFQSFNNGLTRYWHHHTAHCSFSYVVVVAGVANCEQAGRPYSVRSCEVDFQDGYTILEVWKYGKHAGYIAQDDSIPHSALIYHALSQKICTKKGLAGSSRLSGVHYRVAIMMAEKEGINFGRQ